MTQSHTVATRRASELTPRRDHRPYPLQTPINQYSNGCYLIIQDSGRRPSLVGGGGPALFEVLPGGVLVQHVSPVGGPGHDVETVPRLQRVLTPRACLVLRLLQRAGRLKPQQRARTHKDWGRGRRVPGRGCGGRGKREKVEN